MLECLMRSYNSLRKQTKIKLQTFFFQLMRDMFFKKIFAIHFTNLYTEMTKYYLRGIIDFEETLLTFSVQLLTLPTLSTTLAKENKLVDILLESVHNAIASAMTDGDINFKHKIFTDDLIYSLLRNLEYTLSLEGVCDYVFTNRMDLFVNLIKLVEPLQYAVAEVRQRDVHVLFDSNEWAHALDFSHRLFKSYFLLLSRLGKHIKNNSLTMVPNAGSKTVLSAVLSEIEHRMILWFSEPISNVNETALVTNEWLLPPDNNKVEVIDFDTDTKPISFHIPLQRLFTAVVLSALEVKATEFSSLETLLETTSLPTNKLLQFLLEHPLRINVLVAQSKLGLWVRNGASILHQSFHYKSRVFRGHLFELDLCLIQMVACLMSPTQFLVTLLHRFGLLEWFSKEQFQINRQKNSQTTDDQKLKLGIIEELLYLIIWILTERSRICHSREVRRRLRREILHRLWLNKHTASELKRSIPSSVFELKEFDMVLSNIATFRHPKGTEQGTFELKADCVDEFDPFFAFYTNEERENAKEKLREHLQKKIQRDGETAVQEPPLLFTDLLPAFTPLRRLYHSPVLHHIVFDILHYFTPSLLHQCLHLLQIAIIETPEIRNDFFSLTRPFDPEQEEDTILSKLMWLKTQREHSIYHPYVQWIINKLKEKNEYLKGVIQQLSEPKIMSSTTATMTTKTLNTKEERRRRALEARQRIMQKLQSQQNEFIEKHKEELAAVHKDSDIPMEIVKENNEKNNEKMISEKEMKEEECILCREQLNINPIERPWGAIALAQFSQLLFLPLQPSLRKNFVLNSTESGVYIHFCGHCIHFDCYDKYYNSLRQRRQQLLFEGIVLDLSAGEFLCPLCKQTGNTVLPFVPPPSGQFVVTSESSENMIDGSTKESTSATIATTETGTVQSDQIQLGVLTSSSLPREEGPKSNVKTLDTEWTEFLRPFGLCSSSESSNNIGITLSVDPIFNKKSQNLLSAIEAFALRVYCVSKDIEFPDQDIGPFDLQQKLTSCLAYTIAASELAARESTPSSSNNNTNISNIANVTNIICDLDNAIKEKEKKLLKVFADLIMTFAIMSHDDVEYTKRLTALHLQLTEPDGVALSCNCISSLFEHILMIAPLICGTRPPNSTTSPLSFVEYFRTSVSFYFFVQLAQALIVQNFSPLCVSSETETMARFRFNENSPIEIAIREQLTLFENELMAPLIQHLSIKFDEKTKTRNSQLDPNFFGKILALTIPFLRSSALLYSLVFSQTIPPLHGIASETPAPVVEIEHLLNFMELPKLNVLLNASDVKISLLKLWAKQITTKLIALHKSQIESTTQREDTPLIIEWNEYQKILFQLIPPVLNQPEPFRLWPLPTEYTEILQNWMQAKCNKCNDIPEEPSICLLCGTLCCTGSPCCRENDKGECSTHARMCGSQVPFLLVRKASIMLLNRRSAFLYPSPYLDAYGEEDPGLRRGRPLKLNLERYQQLKLLVLQHKIGITNGRAIRNPHLL